MKRHLKTGSATAVLDAPGGEGSSLLDNLQEAYSAETNAHALYLEFAKEADEEGYAPVASLFRAASRAEEIHARNHQEVINGLGVSAKDNPEEIIVRSTWENLSAAMKREAYERDEMYPAFLHQARAEGNRQAARTFHFAHNAEIEHADLFTQARKELERLRGEAVTHYVCPVCGLTLAQDDRSRCTICSTPTDRFEKVS